MTAEEPSQTDDEQERREEAKSRQGRGKSASKEGTAGWAAAAAVNQLRDLVDRPIEHVTGIEKTDDVWKVGIDVVETQRIPDSTDILAMYEVEVDSDGDLTGLRRVRRYLRGRADD